MAENAELMTVNNICNRVYIIRGQQVMLDYDLAEIYGYEVKRLNEQVKRNITRFPEDFMFQLTREEVESVKSQIVISRENNFFEGQGGGYSPRRNPDRHHYSRRQPQRYPRFSWTTLFAFKRFFYADGSPDHARLFLGNLLYSIS